jgi:ActR/RegA family two-component response regulator
MRVLVVEDEDHKISDLIPLVIDVLGRTTDVRLCKSVKNGYLEVAKSDFDFIVLDMALPTFDEDGDAAGLAQAAGGMEIIRFLAKKNSNAKILVVTQYPEVIVNNEIVKLEDLKHYISSRYSWRIAGTILYSYDDRTWRDRFCDILRGLK